MSNNAARGSLAAVLAYFIWGLFPLYWSRLAAVPAVQVLAHRALWCGVAVWLYMSLRRDLSWLGGLTRRQLGLLVLGGLLISVNWGVYVWAVASGHVIDTSLGYFITPLVNVLVAVAVLGERLSLAQRLAVAIAALGVTLLAWQLGAPPWIALVLAFSFGLYGLVRKLAPPLDAVQGLAVESSVMLLPAAAYLAWCQWQGSGRFLHGAPVDDLLLVLGGPLTAIPLALFAWAAQRVSMVALGVMQYIAPSVALVLGIWFFHEPFDGMRPVAFGCIWIALALFTGEALLRYWRSRPPAGGAAAR